MTKMTRIARRARTTCLAVLATSTVALSAASAGEVSLKLGHVLPDNHYISEELVKKFVAGIEEKTDGAVSFSIFPGGQLGKDTPGAIQSGLLDMGVVITGRHAAKFPLTSVGELPQGANGACDGSAKMWALTQPGGILDELEFKPKRLRVLAANMLAPYVLFTNDRKIETLSDVTGIKIWASGPASERAVAAMGGVPVKTASTELYDSVSRGTVDAAIFPYSGLTQYDLEPVLNNVVEGVNFGSGVFFVTIGEAGWGKLDADQQKIVQDEIKTAQASFCSYINQTDAEQRAQTAAIDGYTVSRLEGEGLAEFEAVLKSVGNDWSATMDGAGRRGTDVLQGFRAAEGQ